MFMSSQPVIYGWPGQEPLHHWLGSRLKTMAVYYSHRKLVVNWLGFGNKQICLLCDITFTEQKQQPSM